MRILYSEFSPVYETYSFPYGIYALPEKEDELTQAYRTGFLPYTGDARIEKSIFYKARSLRVHLSDFKDTSENRRTAKKFSDFDIALSPCKPTVGKDTDFISFAISYADERFKKGEMSENRLRHILSRSYLSTVYRYTHGEKTIAYLLSTETSEVFHYWFCFYDLNFAPDLPLGKYLMWRALHYAKNSGFKEVYLGTCYGPGSLYKARDFKGIQFHDGNRWVGDVKILKDRCKKDELMNLKKKDRFKVSPDPNQFIESSQNPNS